MLAHEGEYDRIVACLHEEESTQSSVPRHVEPDAQAAVNDPSFLSCPFFLSLATRRCKAGCATLSPTERCPAACCCRGRAASANSSWRSGSRACCLCENAERGPVRRVQVMPHVGRGPAPRHALVLSASAAQGRVECRRRRRARGHGGSHRRADGERRRLRSSGRRRRHLHRPPPTPSCRPR